MDKLEETLAKILEKALNVAEQTGDFVMEQAPQLLQEFYSWHIAANIMGICLAVVFLLTFIMFYKKSDFDSYEFEFWNFMTIFTGALNIVTFIMFFICVYSLIFILVAPKLYLIEYFIK